LATKATHKLSRLSRLSLSLSFFFVLSLNGSYGGGWRKWQAETAAARPSKADQFPGRDEERKRERLQEISFLPSSEAKEESLHFLGHLDDDNGGGDSGGGGGGGDTSSKPAPPLPGKLLIAN